MIEVTPSSHVGPGERFTYTWKVLEGPSTLDSPCIPYLYYSATDPVRDTNSGLVGPLLVCKKGTLGQKGTQVLRNYPLTKKLSHTCKILNLKHFELVNVSF